MQKTCSHHQTVVHISHASTMPSFQHQCALSGHVLQWSQGSSAARPLNLCQRQYHTSRGQQPPQGYQHDIDSVSVKQRCRLTLTLTACSRGVAGVQACALPYSLPGAGPSLHNSGGAGPQGAAQHGHAPVRLGPTALCHHPPHQPSAGGLLPLCRKLLVMLPLFSPWL